MFRWQMNHALPIFNEERSIFNYMRKQSPITSTVTHANVFAHVKLVDFRAIPSVFMQQKVFFEQHN